MPRHLLDDESNTNEFFCDLQLIGLMDIIIIIVQTRIMVHGEVTEPLYLTHHGVQGLHLVMVGDHELNCL